jgi:signal transduction histidine kinase
MVPLRASIHKKLLVVVLLTAAFALLLTGTAMLYYDLRGFRQAAINDLAAQAEIVGFAAAPAIEFQDPVTAGSYLQSLRGKPSIVAAAIYAANGSRFASYVAEGAGTFEFPAIPGNDGHAVQGRELDVFRRIVSDQEILGTVYIRARYGLVARIWNYLGIVGGAMAVSLLLAILVSQRMQRMITAPILEIARVARDVMDKRDFTVRALKSSDDEIGVMVEAFNGMLAEIDRVIRERGLAQSALVESEARLLALNAELEQRVASRTTQLETANKDLEGFSYSVSHDLRAPIRAVGGFAALLEEDHRTELSEEARRKVAIIRAEASRMGQLIDDLLAFSRLGRKSLEPAELDMAAMAKNVYERLNHADPAKPVEFRLGSMPGAHGDRSLFEQVWVNLLSNAIKFSSKAPQPVIEAGGITTGDEHVFFVRDNGAGFDPKYQGKLFGVFQRLHREDEFPGTGVGLALVHRIVSRHGGRVWADGKPGQGATFHFSLPKEASDGGV